MKTTKSCLPLSLVLCINIGLTIGIQGKLGSASSQNAAGVDLPEGARVLEVRSLADQGYRNRSLVLWMVNPERHPRAAEMVNDPYSCPEETRGSYFSGPVRVSLVDTPNRVVLNTIPIEDSEGHDRLDLPYGIRTGDYYHTTTISKVRETQPILIWLKDYNGDGKALEFAFFEAEACLGLPTTLIGYDPDVDRAVRYAIRTNGRPDGHGTVHTSYWLDYLFHEVPDRPGHWKYEVNYCGRSVTPRSCDGFFEVIYDARTKQFNATVKWMDAAPSPRHKKTPSQPD